MAYRRHKDGLGLNHSAEKVTIVSWTAPIPLSQGQLLLSDLKNDFCGPVRARGGGNAETIEAA